MCKGHSFHHPMPASKELGQKVPRIHIQCPKQSFWCRPEPIGNSLRAHAGAPRTSQRCLHHQHSSSLRGFPFPWQGGILCSYLPRRKSKSSLLRKINSFFAKKSVTKDRDKRVGWVRKIRTIYHSIAETTCHKCIIKEIWNLSTSPFE